MQASERQKIILEYLKNNKVILIKDVVKKFSVSHETVRRDFELLQKQNLITRVHGGAILKEAETDKSKSTISSDKVYVDNLSHIGKEAAKLINDGETIILSIGSTVLEIAKNIKHKKITVLTNSISVINELIDTDIELYVLGGKINSCEHTINGQMAHNNLQNFYVDKTFIGAGGITFDHGISDYNTEESQLINSMIHRGKKTILVADSSKFGMNCFSITCPLNTIDVIISDKNLSDNYITSIKDLGIDVILANDEND